MTDPALTTASRRLLFIESQLQSLRADVDATIAARQYAQARPPERGASAVPPAVPAAAISSPAASSPGPGTTAPANARMRAATPEGSEKPAPPDHRSVTVDDVRAGADGAGRAELARTLGSILSGRGLAVAGVLLMLIGAAYFLDLSFMRGWIPPLERIVLGTAAGFGLLAASMRFLRGPYRLAAECTTGLGAGLVYLASWAAISVFPDLDIPRAAVFAVMAVGTCALAFIANRVRSGPIALMGLTAAYLTPMFSGGFLDRPGLAIYLLIVTSGMLVLARRRSFASVEILAVAGTLAASLAFRPNVFAGWTNDAAAVAASAFFVLFAVAYTIRPIDERASRALQLMPLIVTTVLYIGILEALLNATQTTLGIALAVLGAALLGAAARIRFIPTEIRPVYRCLGLLAVNLALRSLLHRLELFDAFAIEAAGLVIFGSRIGNSPIVRVGLGGFALAALGLGWESVTLAPTQSLLTPLVLGFAIWLQAAFSARRFVPAGMRPAFAIVLHVVALAGLTRAILDATGGPQWNVALPNLTQVGLSLGWALFAALLFALAAS